MSAVLSIPSVRVEPARAAAAEAANRASLTASDRLALSRERLRQAMRGNSEADGDSSSQRARGAASAVMDGLRSIPGADILIEAVGGWWARHPLRAAGLVALEAATAGVRPMARRNPLGLMVVALFLGGLLAWSRPWRWIVSPALLAGLSSQIFRKSVAKVSVESWMDVLLSMLREKRAPSSPSGKPVRAVDRMHQH